MRYCSHCGAEVDDEQYVCVKCGHKVDVPTKENNGLEIAVKVFMIIATITMGMWLIPLAWCIPMTVSVFNNFKNRRPISTAMKVCTLLFVSQIAGILMLCMKDN